MTNYFAQNKSKKYKGDVHENDRDGRRKKLIPTEKLMNKRDGMLEEASRMEEICRILDQEEKEKLWDLGQKLLFRLAQMEQEKMNKE